MKQRPWTEIVTRRVCAFIFDGFRISDSGGSRSVWIQDTYKSQIKKRSNQVCSNFKYDLFFPSSAQFMSYEKLIRRKGNKQRLLNVQESLSSGDVAKIKDFLYIWLVLSETLGFYRAKRWQFGKVFCVILMIFLRLLQGSLYFYSYII